MQSDSKCDQTPRTHCEIISNSDVYKANPNATGNKVKDKKLVFLSRSVLATVRANPNTTGTEIAYQILELYKRFSEKVDFKNVQRRVYDALNVLSAMDIIRKTKN